MNNKDNELFNEIIDIPSSANYSQSNYSQQSFQTNLQASVNQGMQQPKNNDVEVIDVPMDINQSQLEIIDVQPEASMVDLYQDLQAANNNSDTSSLSVQSPEIIGFDTQPEQINEQGKTINHELLQTLNNDTNNLINPDMIINPFGKQEEQNIKVEEPKVDYDEIKTKKGYIFMAIIFLIMIVFIIFLPQIMSFLGI